MKKVLIVFLLAGIILGAAMAAQAERPHGWGIHERIQNLQERIDRGIESGALTRHEARYLQDSLERIRHRVHRMREDGLSHREREKIEYDLDRLERRIRHLKHNERRY